MQELNQVKVPIPKDRGGNSIPPYSGKFFPPPTSRVEFTRSDTSKGQTERTPSYAMGKDADGDYAACVFKKEKLTVTAKAFNKRGKLIGSRTIELKIQR